jgi:hypothetical protein
VQFTDDAEWVLRDDAGDVLVFEEGFAPGTSVEDEPDFDVEVCCDFCGRWSTDAAPLAPGSMELVDVLRWHGCMPESLGPRVAHARRKRGRKSLNCAGGSNGREAFGPRVGLGWTAAPTPEEQKPSRLRGFSLERTTGIEPATLGLGSQCSTG